MHRADGRGLDRLDLTNSRRAHRRQGRKPAEQRHEHEQGQFRAAARRDLPAEREDCAPDGLRPHLQRDAVGARGAGRQRLSDHARVSFPNVDSFGFYNTLSAGRPDDRGAQPEHWPCAARPLGGRVHAGNRQHRPRLRPDLEHRLRAPHHVRHVGGCRLRRRQGHGRLRRAGHQRTDRPRHAATRAPVLRSLGPHRRASTRGATG